MGCMVAPAISVSHECNFGNGCPMTIKQAVSGSRFFYNFNHTIVMLLLQETYPIPAETGAIDDLVIAAILIGIFLF